MLHEFVALRENTFRKYAGRTSLLKRNKQQIITEEKKLQKIVKQSGNCKSVVVYVVALDGEARSLGGCSLTPTSSTPFL